MDIGKLIGSKTSVPSIDFNQVVKSDNLRYWRISKATWEKDKVELHITFEKEDSRYLVVPKDLLQKAIEKNRVKDISHFTVNCAIDSIYSEELPFKMDNFNANSFYSNFWIASRFGLPNDNIPMAHAYIAGDDESLLAAMDRCLKISKEMLFKIIFDIDNMDSYLLYLYRINDSFEDELFCKCNDYDKVIEAELDRRTNTYNWHSTEYFECIKKKIEAIMNDENKHTEIMKKIAERKQRNIDILRKHGIEI